MRKGILSVVLFVFAATASADDRGATRLSVLLSGIGYSESASGSNWAGGGFVALSHRFASQWGVEASYGYERTTASGPLLIEETIGQVILMRPERIRVSVQPLDFTAQYFFPTGESRWKPYAGLGLRHTPTPDGPIVGGVYSETSPQFNFGALVNLTPRLGIRFDGKYLAESNRAPWDDAFKAGLGLSWRF